MAFDYRDLARRARARVLDWTARIFPHKVPVRYVLVGFVVVQHDKLENLGLAQGGQMVRCRTIWKFAGGLHKALGHRPPVNVQLDRQLADRPELRLHPHGSPLVAHRRPRI